MHTTELTKVEGIAKLGYGNVKTPVTIGIIKQYIIFPYYIKNIGENEFRLVLLHEIIHIRRADNFWKLLSFITIAKFWYNPIVWLGIKLFFKDMEICVDYKVINTTKVEPYLYASLLISTAKLAQSQYNVFSNFTSAKTLNERLNKIMNYKKKSILSTLSACILITFVATACGTSKVASQEVVYSDEAIISTNLTEHGLKSEETYIINDQNKNFILKNGCALIFTKEEKWKLEKGEKAALEIALANTEFNIEVGYIKDNGNMNLLFSGLPKSTQTVELIAPDDGNYAFYLLGISSDAVQVKQVSLKVGNSLNLHIDNHIGGNQHEKENF